MRNFLRWLLAAVFLLAGLLHILLPDPFLRIMPSWVPLPRETVMLTGLCEVAGAIGLLTRRWRRTAGAMLALYAVCVFPANIQHAILFARSGSGWTGWLYHVPRLLFQPVIVWWCLFAGGAIHWPFTRTGPADRHPPHPPRAPKA